jgi:hypothetical protein
MLKIASKERIQINQAVRLDASPQAAEFYRFADSLSKYEVATLLKVKGNEYWQQKYLVNLLYGKFSRKR